MMEEIPRERRHFERALAELRSHVQGGSENPKSHGCTDCERCYHCMFTSASRDCFFCTYCHDCKGCSGCTHCTGCENVHDSSYCVDSANCSGSSYLIQCQDCADCVFCFGCVGLVKKEFHILNRPFPRKIYFEIVAGLKEEFGIDK